MHNNFYFLRQLTHSLGNTLNGTVISECFSQNRDELIIRFETHGKPFYLRASLEASFSCLSFPEQFQRARKNSVDLFPGLIGYRVTGVRQHENERSFSLLLEENRTLLFKLHGNRSNVIFFAQGDTPLLFKSNFPLDASIEPEKMDRTIDWSFGAFLANQQQAERYYFTFGKIVWSFLYRHGYGTASTEGQWKMIIDTVTQLQTPSYYLSVLENKLHLTLLPFPDARQTEDNPVTAVNDFFHSFTQEFTLLKEKSELISRLRAKITSGKNYLEKNFARLTELESDTNYKGWADLIMANLDTIRQGNDNAALRSFYNPDEVISIKLKKDLSPQQNAAIYYRKGKNQHIESQRLQESLLIKEKEINALQALISELGSVEDLKVLRKKRQEIQHHVKDKEENLPYHEFIESGFRIWVGRNAEANDILTLKHSYKEDLWLHAKDVAGSHVLIKYQSGKKFPKDVIEKAAQLAAYNSKRKTETLCPVIVTPKKFVRKRKGDPAGLVVVEREEVILVEPKL